MDDFNRKRHAVYKLTYHAVFVIKYRRKVMSEPIIEHMRQYAAHLIGQCYQGRLIELNGEPDYIHILFELPATAAPSVVVCSLKTQLSKEIRANFWDEIKDKLWNNIFWSDSYFITTTGGAGIETIEKYIKNPQCCSTGGFLYRFGTGGLFLRLATACYSSSSNHLQM